MIAEKTKVAVVGEDWDIVDLIETLPELEMRGFFAPALSHSAMHLGNDSAWEAVKTAQPHLKIVLAVDDPKMRARLWDHYGKEAVISLISPHAYRSPRAVLEAGCIVQRGVTIMPDARLGTCCKVNVNATIHHDAQIGDFCTLAPGALILGNVRIENEVYVGAGAIIKQRCKIGSGTVIGAGAVVVCDIPPNVTVVGVPAKQKIPTNTRRFDL